jgi:hypothetical protein
MRAGSRTSPAMRVLAAVVLVCWSVALGICWHHCATGACSSRTAAAKEAKPGCHAHADDSDSDQSNPNDSGSSCFAKKPFAGDKEIFNVAAPSLHLTYVAAALNGIAFELPQATGAAEFRQAKPRVWVFTPEVSLGPAFRSLAPPVLC